MENDVPVRQPSLADQVYNILMKEISAGMYPAGALLPSENLLAERFAVSRPTIRAAFARLVERGYVKRQRGVGTYIADKPSIANPLYQLIDITERISARGFTPGFRQLGAVLIKADDNLSKKLDVPVNSSILNIHKIFFADDAPIILFINYIPEWVYIDCLSSTQALEPGITEPFFEFFANKCRHKVNYLASTIWPEVVTNLALPEEFIQDNSCNMLLIIEDIGYNDDDVPLFLSVEHLAREASTFHIIRSVDNL